MLILLLFLLWLFAFYIAKFCTDYTSTNIPSGTITIKDAPTNKPAPNIAIKFIIFYEVLSFDGKNPIRNVIKNIPKESNMTSSD